jgi:G3E family GTPase
VNAEAGAVDPRTPVHILTGFLGSGKTTLLRRLLADPALADTAVVINEFGEIGLDQLLVREVAEDVILLSSGCLCCTVRDDLISTLADLHRMMRSGEIPPFARAVVETTGLADPAPIMQAVLGAKELVPHYRLGQVVATVDGLNGGRTLQLQREARRQAAMADRVVVTKCDLIDASDRTVLVARLAELNPHATIDLSDRLGSASASPSVDLFASQGRPWQELRAAADPARSADGHDHAGSDHDEPAHDGTIGSFTVFPGAALDWADFVDWLDLLLASRGDSILRVKGLIAIRGDDRPVVLQGVQHVVYPPERLPAWPPSSPAGGWIVFIARDLTRSAIENSLRLLLEGAPA